MNLLIKNNNRLIIEEDYFKDPSIKKIVYIRPQLRCERCGTNKDLEFHHIDPFDKDRTMNILTCSNKLKVLKEIKKCQILCVDCHNKAHNSKSSKTLYNKKLSPLVKAYYKRKEEQEQNQIEIRRR